MLLLSQRSPQPQADGITVLSSFSWGGNQGWEWLSNFPQDNTATKKQSGDSQAVKCSKESVETAARLPPPES